jgi:hypothetical protein
MTIRHLPALLALATLLMANSCQTSQVAETSDAQVIEGALQGAEVTALLTGNTGYGEEAAYNWRTYFGADGALSGRRWSDAYQETDRGTWEITAENQLCTQWQVKWDALKRACFEVYKDGETVKMLNMDGNADSYEMQLAAGDRLSS